MRGKEENHRMIRYRRPKQDDPVIFDLVQKQLVPHSSLPSHEIETILKELPKRLSRGVTLVASPYYEADPVAFIHFLVYGDLLYIDMMAVAPAYQRKRYGQALMLHAEHFAASRECIRAKVMVDRDNTRAHLFYRKMGYSRKRFIEATKCYEMEKILNFYI